MPSWRGSGLALIGLAFALACLGGCRACTVHLAEGTPPRETWRLAMLPLDDAGAQHVARDYLFCGRIGAQGSGAVLGRTLARALATQPALNLLADPASLARQERLSMEELAALPDDRACAIARRLAADLLVRGRVAQYETFWVLFWPRAKAALELRALDPQSGAVLWTAQASGKAHFASVGSLAEKLSREVAAKVAQATVAR